MLNVPFQSKDSQQIIIGRKNLIVNEQKRTTQRIAVSVSTRPGRGLYRLIGNCF